MERLSGQSEIEQNLQKANPANIWDLMELLSLK